MLLYCRGRPLAGVKAGPPVSDADRIQRAINVYIVSTKVILHI